MLGMIARTVGLCGLLAGLAGAALPATFIDVFDSEPGLIGRQPFMWWVPARGPEGRSAWEIVDGALQYRSEASILGGAFAGHWDAGVELSDSSAWTLETSFRHISGTAPSAQYETVAYVRWASDTPAHIGLLYLCYDAAGGRLTFGNGDAKHDPISVDLTGDFHPVRIVVSDRQVRVYVDGELRSGPHDLRSLKWEGPPQFILGPITRTENHTLCCQWKYFAFTDEGARAPDDVAAWDPSQASEPMAVPIVDLAPAPEDPTACFRQPPYSDIALLSRRPGHEAYNEALPRVAKRWRDHCAGLPGQMSVPFYRYPDADGPPQNVYRDVMPAKSDNGRCVAVYHMTRGTGDTIFGFSDYKLWYCTSTDGGSTWGDERPLVQQGEAYSRTHPVEYVWIGTNSFVYATLPGFLYPLSSGRLLLPCYYLPLDGDGKPMNPLETSTYSQVFCLIGTWNEAGDDVEWDVSHPITLGTDQSTSGLSECAVIELRDRPGHVLMVIRAGNEGDRTRSVPSWKWKTLSTDYGRTWSELTPFAFSDGTRFFSPTAQSSLIRGSRTGKVYWIGNISRVRPKSGWPRYPLVMAELDEETLGLRKETVTIIDDRAPGDGSNMQLSNFGSIEDPATGHILIRLNRLNGAPGANGPQTYTVAVE
ncbi:MAG TPA: sialidase family protein [Armatimonadota bacterium]|nr:sialidase family protein [Armatimonadota bacterium]